MIMLDLPKEQLARLEQASSQAGLSTSDYIAMLIDKHSKPTTNSMVARVKQMPKPTSYDTKPVSRRLLTDLLDELPPAEFTGDPVAIQRAMRDEWD